ncbi:MAG TPA: hypothetical protein VMV83_03245 [Rectinemataceae bacterium]|nr:hypothetical protein [Rectinemataceae bacterium]
MAIEAGGSPPGLPRPAVASLLAFNADQGASLRVGVVVSVRVIGEAGAGHWRLSVSGPNLLATTLVAKSERAFAAGEAFRAKVERGASGFVLRPLAEQGEREAALLGSLGLPTDAGARAALLASLAAGLRPEAGRLARMRKAIGEPESGEERLRDRAAMAARLEARGLGSDASAVDRLEALASGGGDGRDEGYGSRDQGEEGHAARPSAGEGKEPPPPSDPIAAGEEEIAGIATMLAKFALRKADPGRDGDEGLLGLFNHLGGRSGVLLPFAFRYGNIAFEGSLLVQLQRSMGGISSIEGRFAAFRPEASRLPEREWLFVYQPKGRGLSRLRMEPPAWGGNRDWNALAASLEASGCELIVGPIEREGASFGEVYVEA